MMFMQNNNDIHTTNRYKKILLFVLMSFQSVNAFELSEKAVDIIAGSLAVGFSGSSFCIKGENSKLRAFCGVAGICYGFVAKKLLQQYTPEYKKDKHDAFIADLLNNLEFNVLKMKKSLDKNIFQNIETQECAVDFAIKEFVYEKYPLLSCIYYLEDAYETVKLLEFTSDLYAKIDKEDGNNNCVIYSKPFDGRKYQETINTYLFYIKTSDLEAKDKSRVEEYIQYIKSFDYEKYKEMIKTYLFYIKTSDRYIKELSLKKLDSIDSNICSLIGSTRANGRQWYWIPPFFWVIPS